MRGRGWSDTKEPGEMGSPATPVRRYSIKSAEGKGKRQHMGTPVVYVEGRKE